MPPLLSRIQATPFLKLLLPLGLGILIQEEINRQFLYQLPFIVGIIFIMCSKIPSTAVTKYKYRALFGLGTFCLLFSIGAFRLYKTQPTSPLDIDEQITTNAIVRIENEPKEKENSWQAYGMALIETDSTTYSLPILLYLAKDSIYTPQKQDLLSCWLSVYPVANSGNPDAFDFKTYMRRKGIIYSGYSSSYSIASTAKESGFKHTITSIQLKIRELIRSIFNNQNEQAFANAIIMGYTNDIPSEVREDFSKSGLSHILAVSGLHTAILFALILFLLWPLRLLRLKKLIYLIAIVCMWGYALLTGMPASVIRAVCMITIYLVGKILYQQSNALNALFITAFAMLLYNPFYLYDVGFQLSFLAVLSILIYQPFFQSLFPSIPSYLRAALNLIYVSISAQILVLPLSLYYFHLVPTWFLPANLIILPFLSPLTFCTIFCMALQYIGVSFPLLNQMLNETVSLILRLNSGFASLPSFTSVYPSVITILLVYLLIIAVTLVFIHKKAPYLIVSLCMLILLLGHIGFTPQDYPASEVIVFNQRSSNAIHFIHQQEHYLYHPDSLHTDSIPTNYYADVARKRELQPPLYLTNDTVIDSKIYIRKPFVMIADKRFCILTDDMFRYKSAATKPQVDYLMIGGTCRSTLTHLQNLIQFDTLIVQPTLPRYRQELLQSEADSLQIPIHKISRNGAFRLTINL